MKLLIVALLAASGFSQTSPFPVTLDSSATLGVPADGVYSALTAPMLIGATAGTVANATNIPQWAIITFGSELMQVCSKSGNILTFGTPTVCPSIAGRGLSGTTVAAHNTGVIGYLNINSYYQKALASAVIAAQSKMSNESRSLADFGCIGDDSTDDSVCFQAALDWAESTGGRIRVARPSVAYRINSKMTIHNDGGSSPTPKQGSIILDCDGDGANTPEGTAHTPFKSAVFDMRYSGTVARFVSLGSGYLEIRGCGFINGGTSSTPFFLTTNTTLNFHDNSCIGTLTKVGSGGTTDEDCVILGGTTITEDGSVTAAYQGYGSRVVNNYFNHIRRAVYTRVYSNGAVIKDNTGWLGNGGGSGYGFIEMDGGLGGCIQGGTISGNIIETAYYVHPIRLTYACHVSVDSNGFYDNTNTTVDYVYLGTLSAQNYIHHTLSPASGTTIKTTDVNGTNSVCDSDFNTFTCGTPASAGIGLRGVATAGVGIQGNDTSSGYGVFGSSVSGEGVRGQIASASEAVAGVNTSSGVGTYGSSSSGYGGFFTSTTGEGVRGSVSSTSEAVAGVNTSATGNGIGVYGTATAAHGGWFTATTGEGLRAETTNSGIALNVIVNSNTYLKVNTSGITMPFLGATSGKVFLCVDTAGLVSKNASASCAGTP